MDTLSNIFNIDINKSDVPQPGTEVVSNMFNINIEKVFMFNEVVSNMFNITIEKDITIPNNPPTISNISVSNITNGGSYLITYTLDDLDDDKMKVSLKIGDKGYVEIANGLGNGIKTYRGYGLLTGSYDCYLKVSDGKDESVSDMFTIVVDGVSGNDLKARWDDYASALQGLRLVMQKCAEKIAQVKADKSEANAKKHTEAEIKVVSDAISLKVSQTDYDKNNNVISDKFSEMKQTVDQFEFKLISSVGYNKLLNSKFANKEHEKWEFANGAYRYYDRSDAYAKEGRISICNTNKTPGHFGTDIQGGMKPNTRYTINIAIKKESNVIGTNAYFDYYKDEVYVSTQRVDFFNTEGERHNVTFESLAGDYNRGRFYIEHKGSNISGWDFLVILDTPCLVEGDSCFGWTPSPNEVYDGITTIDKDGVKVSMSDGEGEQGSTLLSHHGVEIFDSKRNRKAWFGDNDNAFIDSLNTNRIESPNIVKRHMGNVTLYISPTQSGNGSGENATNRIGGIQNAINKIRFQYGEYIHGNVTLYVAGGNYNEDIWVEGFVGAGRFMVYLDRAAVINGRFGIDNMNKDVLIHGARTNNNTNDGAQIIFNSTDNGQSCIWIRKSSVSVEGIRSYNRAAGNGSYYSKFIGMENGSSCFMYSCDISRYQFGMAATVSCVGAMASGRGFCYTSAATMYGGHLSINNGAIEKSPSWASEGGEIHISGEKYGSLYDPNYGGNTPPSPPPQTWEWFENSFSASNLRSIPEGSGNGTSSRTGEMGQGKWGSYKPHRGYADLGSSPSSWSSGGRNFTVWITMTRLNTNHGYAGAVPTPKIKQPNGSFWNSNIKFARGETKTIQLPSDIASVIVNGSMKNIELWAGTSINDYSFYNNVSVKIKCEKQV